jgi:plastocyanin
VRRACARLGALGAALGALALGGCGLEVGSPPSTVKLLITRDFGAQVLHSTGALHTTGGESVLELLQRNATVVTGPGGRRVQDIDGVAGSSGAGTGAPSEWLYYVNGVQASKGPAAASVKPGDHIWWDLHDTSQAHDVPAVVGAFPEPFLNGYEGKRLPIRVECASSSTACRTVTETLQSAGVPAALAAIGSGGAPETLRVMVGPWSHLGGDLEAASIGRGPAASGVYARFSADAQTLTLLDEQGRPVRALHGDAGLVAATRGVKEAPVWVITGTDDAGVELAARAFNRQALEDRFAVALTSAGPIALPVASQGTP